MKVEQQSVEVHRRETSIYDLSTNQIKSELGTWPEEYKAHCTGRPQFDCELLWGEKNGIVNWMLEQGAIGMHRMAYNGSTVHYWAITQLDAWKRFERNLELLRALYYRQELARKEEKKINDNLAKTVHK